MDPEFTCGNDLRFIEWWLIRHGRDPGDPVYKQLVGDLAQVTRSLVQVLVSAQINNHELAREFRFESARALTAAAGKLASVNAVAVSI